MNTVQYCPTVPFRPDLVFCYPKLTLSFYDNLFYVVLFSSLIGILVRLIYEEAKRKR